LGLGRSGEDAAIRFLEGKGASILERNYRCVFGEIDIIAGKGKIIAFVEVKTRRGMRYGRPYEAVGSNKQVHIKRAAECYIQAMQRAGRDFRDTEFRFDIAEIMSRGGDESINYIENAF